MHAKPEFRASERFSHEHVITLEDGPTLTQYYAESCNLSEMGMYFESPFELYPEDHVLVRIDGYKFSQNQVPAKVVWCKKLKGTSFFSYGVGVEFA
jgi:Tfp pilus assembly protein PilZ